MADEENLKPDKNSSEEDQTQNKDTDPADDNTSTEDKRGIDTGEDGQISETGEPQDDLLDLNKQIMDEALRAQDAVRMAEQSMADQSNNPENHEDENSDS